MFDFFKMIKKYSPTKEEISEILKTSPEALEAFERAYAVGSLSDGYDEFPTNAKEAAEMNAGVPQSGFPQIEDIMRRIVSELMGNSVALVYDGKNMYVREGLKDADLNPVSKEEIESLPIHQRPQFTGRLTQIDINEPSSHMLLDHYHLYKTEKDPKKGKIHYHLFRQGLDILDIDPVLYEMLGMNQNAIGYWLPYMVKAAQGGFFKIPATTIIKVPITLLQLTRLDYGRLNRTTLDIVDDYCRQIFDLDLEKEYFIKNGVFSSKFDFRNARVSGAKEVRELGEYLLFIHNQATMMAGPLTSPSIYGAATTNEWAVREFIKDKEGNPCIYHGLPLHTEYRLFVDFDTKKVIGMTPYWDPATMKKRFGEGADQKDPDMYHDYVIYSAHEEILMDRYNKSKNLVKAQMESLIQKVDGLTGQWSVDVMQNGDDFWLIDMAWAQNSAFYSVVPEHLRIPMTEDWIPKLPEKVNK